MTKLILSLVFATAAIGLQAGENKTAEKAKDAACCATVAAACDVKADACCMGKSAAASKSSKIVMSPKAAEKVRKI